MDISIESTVALSPGRPLTPAQRPLWLSQRLYPDAPVQNMALLTHIEGTVDADRLADAFEATVAGTDVLRTRITDDRGTPVVTLDAVPARTEILDLDRAGAEDWATERVRAPIDTEVRGYDSAVLRHEDGTASWYLCLHHAVTDATASALVFAATAARYHNEEPPAGGYYRWADGLHGRLAAAQAHPEANGNGNGNGNGAAAADQATTKLARALDHWARRSPSQPVDRLYRPQRERTPLASRTPVALDDGLAAELAAALDGDYRLLSPDLGWTALAMTATAAFLHQVAGVDDVALGLPVHNRGDAATRGLMGPLMEVFPVDVSIEAGDTFRTLHKRVARAVLTTLANAQPGAAPPGDVPAVINVIPRAPVGPFGPIPTSTQWIHSGAIDAGHLLRVQVTAYDEGDPGPGSTRDGLPETGHPSRTGPTIALDLNHATAGPEHRERAAGHFRRLLASLVADPDGPITVPLPGPVEAAAIDAWEVGADFDGPTLGLVPRLARALGNRSDVALRQGDRTMTGTEVWSRSLEVARWLRGQGLAPGDRVGIEMARSAEAVIAILGVLVAGGSFVPLEVTQPERRRRELARRASCRLVLTTLPDPDDLAAASGIDLDFDPDPDLPTGAAAGFERDLEREAYLLFTSGSTGRPKGVPISHRGLARYLRFAEESYVEPGPGPVVPLFSSLGFDLTITSLFLPFLTGGVQVVIPDEGPAGLAAIAADSGITWCKATPSHLEILLRLLPPDHALSTVVVGGEAFGSGLAQRLHDHRADLAMFNEYGPTEAVVGCMIHRVDPKRLDESPEVPIGVPAPGVRLRVVGPGDQRAPIGSAGELLISHVGVTGGYLADDHAPDDHAPDDNAPAADDPFVELADRDGTVRRYYRSGDLVRMVDDGTLVYLGRIDEQVKVGGIRLEPTEVEEALTAHPAIAAAAVRLWSPSHREPEQRCVRCGLPSNVPGTSFDAAGVCNVCHDYDRVAPQASSWFKTPDDLRAKRDEARARRTGRYDCLHLLSGGKDSTYALYQLVEAGFTPYVLTLDNGFISEGAKENVRRSVADLGLDHEFATTAAMDAIFRDSLERHSNVCHGCYKTIYTLATNRAAELGIPVIVTGLSRGQLFETRLIPQQFESGRFDPDAIDRAVLSARKTYHRLDDGPNRLLDTEIFATDEVFDRIEYLDFYRYVDVELAEMLEFLDTRAPWVRPADTGRSTNCLINAAGIHTHQTEQGYHNYAAPYAWDVRLGHKTRDEAIEELDDQLDPVEVRRLLDAVGYVPRPAEILTAWLEPTDPDRALPTPAELRALLAEVLPAHAVPAAFVAVDALPLSTNGKLDPRALPAPDRIHRPAAGIGVAAETELEATIIGLWEVLLRTEPIGATDDFFVLGGDSLRALEMIVALGDAVGRPLADELAFAHTTPRALAAAVEADDRRLPDGAGAPEPPPPAQAGIWTAENPPPLGPGEQSLLFEQSLRPDEPMYNLARLYRVEAPVDPDALATAVRAVAARHASFSWNYDRPRRLLAADRAVVVDIGRAPMLYADFEREAGRRQRRRLDLVDGPLLQTWIQALDGGDTGVLFLCHHLSSDAESFDRFWAQLDAELRGRPIEPEFDYPSFVAWQQEVLTETDRDHWLPAADWQPASVVVAAPPAGTPDGFLTRRSASSAADLARRPGATTFSTALAAFAATLRRHTDGDDVALSMVSSTRDHRAADDLVGYFINALPVELRVPLDMPLDDVVSEATVVMAANLAHRTYPYARMVDDRRRAGGRVPDRQILVVYVELDTATLLGSPVHQEILSADAAVADATLWVQRRDDDLDLSLEYRGTFLDRAAAERLLADVDAVLGLMAGSTPVTVGHLELPSTGDTVLVGPELDAPDTLLVRIAANAEARADRAAVICGDRTLTWAELDARSTALAHRLGAEGVGPGARVLVALPRSAELMVAIVAVLRAGAAYVPVDPSYPADRIEATVAAAGAAAVLVPPGVEPPPGSGTPLVVDLDRPDTGPGTNADTTADTALPTVTGADTAYVIFTSGSTGTPRGVPVDHGRLAASTVARAQVYDRPVERFLLVSSLAFDSSVAGLFWALADGGTIVVPTDREAHDPDALLGLLRDRSITHTLLVPTLYGALLGRADNDNRWPDQVIVAGEACPPALVERHHRHRPGSALANEYGPTEATVWATAHHCVPGDDPVPIGRPIPGTWVAVVDDDDNPRPQGTEGQLIIGGAGVVDGYLDDPDATRQRFGHGPRGSFFRTGDRAVLIDGTVHFLGRIDNQLNVGGVRAEPEDIESVLTTDPAVTAAVVTALDPRSTDELMAAVEPGLLRTLMGRTASSPDPASDLLRLLRTAPGTDPALVAFLQPSPGTDIDLERVRDLVRDSLPATLRPTRYTVVPRLPLSPNGKIDRDGVRALPVATPPSVGDGPGVRGPESGDGSGGDLGIEVAEVAELAELFARTLVLDRVLPDQSFFDLGGHSLSAMELLAEIERRFDLDLTVTTLYDHPTPRLLGRLIEARRPLPEQFRFLVPIQPEGTRPPLFGIHVLGINAEFYRPLAARLGTDQPVWGLGLPTATPDTSTPTEVTVVAERYVDEIERCSPTGPLALAAVSLGSVVAFEVAHQLRARGRTVTVLAMFDAVGPSVAEDAPTTGDRLRTHGRELLRSPGTYVVDRAAKVRDRLERRGQVVNLKVRRRLGLPVSDALQIREFVEANWASQQSYRFEPYDDAIVVYKADDAFTRQMAETDMGWTGVATGPFRVTPVDGGHLSMLAEPHVEALARTMAADLDEALARAEDEVPPATAERPGRATPPVGVGATTGPHHGRRGRGHRRGGAG